MNKSAILLKAISHTRSINIQAILFISRFIFMETLFQFSMAGQEGIEPPTFGFGDRRSAN